MLAWHAQGERTCSGSDLHVPVRHPCVVTGDQAELWAPKREVLFMGVQISIRFLYL